MIRKIISIICATMVILIPKMIHAQDGRVTSLLESQKAPYSGILLDNLAWAKVVSDKKIIEEKHLLEVEKLTQKLRADYQFKIEKLELSVASMKERYEKIDALKDAEINRLRIIAGEGTDWTPFWFVGGVLLGVAATIGIAFAVGEIK